MLYKQPARQRYIEQYTYLPVTYQRTLYMFVRGISFQCTV